jgi:hypothetical protein
VEPELNLSFKLSAGWLCVCPDAVTYCMLRTKPKGRVVLTRALVFAITYAGVALAKARGG